MSTTLWIVLAVAGLVILVYLVTLRAFYRQSRELDKQIDYTKIRPWKDED